MMSTSQKFLVTTDFSDNASAIYAFVEEMAKDYEATIDLIHIISEPYYFPMDLRAEAFPIDKSKQTEFNKKIKAKLDKEATVKIPERYRGKTILKTGNPAEIIKEVAEEGDYDLIMIASRGEGDSIFNKGSVTEKLIRISKTPILSVLKGNKPEFKRITVPTDGSNISFEALPLAFNLAVKRKAQIDLLCISKADYTKVRSDGYTPHYQKDEAVKDYIMKGLEEFIKEGTSALQFKSEPRPEDETFQLQDEKGNSVEISVVIKRGTSAHLAVVDYATNNTQLVVMATHGHSKLASMFLGSTTEKVFKNLKMPIMTVKPEFV